jgi:hypothetical protein
MPTVGTEVRAAPSPVLPANTVAGRGHAEHANRGQRSALSFRSRHHSGWLEPRRSSEQRPDQRPHLSYQPPHRLAEPSPTSRPHWLTEPTPNHRTEARAAPAPLEPATTVAGSANVDRGNGGQSSAITCRSHHHSGWLGPHRLSEQGPDQRPHLSCPPSEWLPEATRRCEQRPGQRPQFSYPPPQWLAEPKPTERTEATAAPSPVVPANTVAGCDPAD